MYQVFLKGCKQPITLSSCNIAYTPAELPETFLLFFSEHNDELVAQIWYPDVDIVVVPEDETVLPLFFKPVLIK